MLALEVALGEFERDDGVRAIVLTGAGERAFVAGGDIADLDSRKGLAHYQEFAEVIHRVFRRFELSGKPTIGAINSWALGGGTELLLTLDIRLVAQEARLGLPEITLGLFPGAGGSQRLIRQIPLCRAKEMMFTGEQITADEAVARGLCNRTVAREKLLDEALAVAQKSPLTLKLLKRALRDGLEMPLPSALAHEQADRFGLGQRRRTRGLPGLPRKAGSQGGLSGPSRRGRHGRLDNDVDIRESSDAALGARRLWRVEPRILQMRQPQGSTIRTS